MKKLVDLAVVAGLILALAQAAFAVEVTTERTVREHGKPGVVSVETTIIKVHIVSVDQANRTVKLRTPDGEVNEYEVSEDVKNLGQVKAGDVLTAKEVQYLNIYAEKSKARPYMKESSTLTRAPEGAKPGLVATDKIKIVGKVQSVQYNKRKLVVLGPHGKTKTFDVAPDVKNLRRVKPGDVVVVVYTDTLRLTVATPKE